jgi:hypothetical protein
VHKKKKSFNKDILNEGPGGRIARRLAAESNNRRQTKRDREKEDLHYQFGMSVTHQTCNYVQDTATLQRDLQCAFDSSHRVKEILILRCIANIPYFKMCCCLFTNFTVIIVLGNLYLEAFLRITFGANLQNPKEI